jgi:hypothetical protein
LNFCFNSNHPSLGASQLGNGEWQGGKSLAFALHFLKYFYIENASAFVDVQLPNMLEALNKALSSQRNAAQCGELRDVCEVIRINSEVC